MEVIKKLFALALLKYWSLLPLFRERHCNNLKCFCDRSKNSKRFPAPSPAGMMVCSHLLCVIKGYQYLHQPRLLLWNFHTSGNPDREEQAKWHPSSTQPAAPRLFRIAVVTSSQAEEFLLFERL